MAFDLTSYKLLSFDIYATLIDWETGILAALHPLLTQLPASSPYHLPPGSTPLTPTSTTGRALLSAFATHERTLQATHPSLAYNHLLSKVYTLLATQTLGLHPLPSSATSDAQAFGASVGDYPAFADTVAAMRLLGTHYKLVALSNVDNANFARTLSGPLEGRVRFDAVYTAEDIGSYKPDPRNFEYLIAHVGDELGVLRKDEILHTAQSLTHDHVPAKQVGLRPGVWIRRGGGSKKGGDGGGGGSVMGGDVESLQREGKVLLGAAYETLGEMAEAVERAFKGRDGAD